MILLVAWRRLVFIGCCIFAFTLPFDFPLKHLNIHLPLIKSFLEAEIILLLVLWELAIIFERRLSVKTTYLIFPFLAFLLIHFFSSAIPSTKPIWSLKYTLRFFGLGAIFFMIINFIHEQKQLDSLIKCLFIGSGLAAAFVVIQYFRPYLLTDVQYFFKDIVINPKRIRGLFGWPTDMTVYLGSLIPLLISCIIYKPGKDKVWEKAGFIFLVFIIVLALILSQARGWVLGLFFGLCALWVMHLIRQKDYVSLWITVLLILVGVLLFFGLGMYKFIISNLEPTELFRKKLAQEALTMIKAHPFKGLGADMFYWRLPNPFRTHNIILETTVNLGFFGFLVLLWFLVSVFRIISRGIFKGTNFRDSYIQIGITASLVSYLGHNLVDYFWQLSEISGLFWMLAGIGVSASLIFKEQ